MPKLSVIIPVFNGADHLNNCLNSLSCSSFKDFEVLLIDDGSTDESAKICQEWSLKDNRFHYFYKKNEGQPSTWNFGLEKAVGKYVAFVDDDDLINYNMYSSLISDAEANNAMVSCCSYKKEYRDYKEVQKELSTKEKKNCFIFKNSSEALNAVLRRKDSIEGMIWNKIYSKEILKNVRFNTTFELVNDAVFSIELFSKDFVTVYRPICGYHWMQHSNNQTIVSNYKKYLSAAKGFRYLIDYTKNRPSNIRIPLIMQYLNWLTHAYKKLVLSKGFISEGEFNQARNEIVSGLIEFKNYFSKLGFKRRQIAKMILNHPSIYSFLASHF